jgi:hypothetical protein
MKGEARPWGCIVVKRTEFELFQEIVDGKGLCVAVAGKRWDNVSFCFIYYFLYSYKTQWTFSENFHLQKDKFNCIEVINLILPVE